MKLPNPLYQGIPGVLSRYRMTFRGVRELRFITPPKYSMHFVIYLLP